MSFRKRGEMLSGREGRVGAVPGRSPNGNPSAVLGRAPMEGTAASRLPNRGSRLGARSADGTTKIPVGRMETLNIRDQGKVQTVELQDITALDASHPGIRPSPATSQQTTSTGCSYLDKIMGHMGLPLGNSLLVEEQSTTEFSSVLCKLFASQGVLNNRADSTSGNTHLIVLSSNQHFGKELPGLYKGSRKDIKKTKIEEEQSKVTVQNLTEQSNPTRYKDLKIAWRYKLGDENDGSSDSNRAVLDNEKKNYNNQFDITTRLVPAPTSSELSFISPIQPPQTVLVQLEQAIKRHERKLIRIVIPSLLHPAVYPPKMFSLSGIIPLLHGIRCLVKKYENRCVLFTTLSSDILDELLLAQIENTFDSVINLEPFSQEMMQFLERAYKTQPNKVQHGFLHVLKLPVFSDRGEMHVIKSNLAFRNGRKKFEIEEWGIPVDDVDDNSVDISASVTGQQTTERSNRNTKISLDF